VKAALLALPATLDETYERMLQNIAAEDQAYALTLLRWLAYSQAPLRLDEVAEISTIVPGEDPAAHDVVDIYNRGGLTDVLDILAGLVVMKDTKIRLAHFSVKEYLESTRTRGSVAQSFRLDPTREHRLIKESCLVYLMHYSNSEQKASSKQDLVVFPLLDYAAAMWYRHALLQQAEDYRCEIQLLESKTHQADWLKIHKPDMSWSRPFDNDDYDDKASSLYYASFIGRVGVVQLLLEAKADVNAQGGRYGTALQAASLRGYDKVVRLLLEAEADVNAQGGDYGNALQAASLRGYDKVVRLLLEAEADVNAQGGDYGTALYAASSGGHDKVVRLLLEAEADVNAQGGQYGTALYAASSRGHDKVVQLLLFAGAINKTGEDENTEE
ncbi:ankyrin, partial [Dissoconium aciculare CBS 342.82]|uniref:Ankyrin n=1 Tax=Dissoconium aciculare CBS 342.82 TaxID=1314786 RepID=A0A6J3LYP9_9PEZI